MSHIPLQSEDQEVDEVKPEVTIEDAEELIDSLLTGKATLADPEPELSKQMQAAMAPLMGFVDLEKLLSDSLKLANEKQKLRQVRATLKRDDIPLVERAALQQIVLAWELKREWNVCADVMLFDVQQCSHCGSLHKHFRGQFQRQSHKTSKIDRWIRGNPVSNMGLPKEVKYDMEYVAVCGECVEEFGWKNPENLPNEVEVAAVAELEYCEGSAQLFLGFNKQE